MSPPEPSIVTVTISADDSPKPAWTYAGPLIMESGGNYSLRMPKPFPEVLFNLDPATAEAYYFPKQNQPQPNGVKLSLVSSTSVSLIVSLAVIKGPLGAAALTVTTMPGRGPTESYHNGPEVTNTGDGDPY
jgi:hypothetical protein